MNLATRPFYNDRAVHLVLAAIGLAAVAVLGLEAARLAELSRAYDALQREAEAAESEAAAVARETAGLERDTPPDAADALTASADEVNRLIRQRLFSWTAFFEVIEQTLPADVMLSAVRPDTDDAGAEVALEVIGRTVADIEEFIRRLEESGVFADVLARQGERNDEGMYRAQLRGRLAPRGAGAGRGGPAADRDEPLEGA